MCFALIVGENALCPLAQAVAAEAGFRPVLVEPCGTAIDAALKEREYVVAILLGPSGSGLIFSLFCELIRERQNACHIIIVSEDETLINRCSVKGASRRVIVREGNERIRLKEELAACFRIQRNVTATDEIVFQQGEVRVALMRTTIGVPPERILRLETPDMKVHFTLPQGADLSALLPSALGYAADRPPSPH